MAPIPNIRIDELIERYSVILLDAYGVLVTNRGALPGAARLVEHLNRAGKPYYLLTNDATKPPLIAAERYQGFGLPIDSGRIISSGALLAGYFLEHGLRGSRCVVLGPEGSRHYVEQAGGHVVAPRERFDVLVVADQTGFSFLETVDATLTRLIAQIDGGESVHLLLPNPDLIYPTPNGFGITAGSIAMIFEIALRLRYPDRPDLSFVALGKPQPALFAEAARRSGSQDLVMIGDQLATDIAGASAFGIDSALLVGGVSRPTNCADAGGPRPTYLLCSLDTWA